MANLYDSSSSAAIYSEPSDDISLLLRQILFKSSSSSASLNPNQQPPPPSSSTVVPTFSSANVIPANGVAAHVSSSSADYDADDQYDCESEEGFENLMEEMGAKRNPGRNPSKRTRAAEVHNLSEKVTPYVHKVNPFDYLTITDQNDRLLIQRRRSRINEKMKALQKLIPNSNKTDKASMLDEAIEYLKQLQLQVQMLTMRNGVNLYSMCAPPDILEQNQRTGGFSQGNPSANLERLVNPMVSLPNQCASQNQPLVLDFSHSVNHEPTFGAQRGSSLFPDS
ncbi:hypothetical protein OSB04_007607 [Centaurea solstitialis]|uniref:BHLH domain-containing protein n=1 Tax=Centaurea solstitialis TaxID=347529 RepID=A0AA38WIM8_9ASTR|nr:hypothetical protein OSB04_007607 [Centaurea solstitialis]